MLYFRFLIIIFVALGGWEIQKAHKIVAEGEEKKETNADWVSSTYQKMNLVHFYFYLN